MVEKLAFNLQNMDPMLKGFIEEGSLRSLQGAEAGQEAVVLEEAPDIVMMIITRGSIGGEVAAGAEIGMIGTMAGNKAITIEAGVVAIVQTMTEDIMMMSVGAGVSLLKVVILEGACHLAGPLQGVEALIGAADHQAVVFHQMVAILILGALHHVVLMRSDWRSLLLPYFLVVLVGLDPSMILVSSVYEDNSNM